jgi:hypothetical protein
VGQPRRINIPDVLGELRRDHGGRGVPPIDLKGRARQRRRSAEENAFHQASKACGVCGIISGYAFSPLATSFSPVKCHQPLPRWIEAFTVGEMTMEQKVVRVLEVIAGVSLAMPGLRLSEAQ